MPKPVITGSAAKFFCNINQEKSMQTKMKTTELTGAALDWAVAKCADLLNLGAKKESGLIWITDGEGSTRPFMPSADWDQAGPIILKEKIGVVYDHDRVFDADEAVEPWLATMVFHWPLEGEWNASADDPRVAAMRCLVLSRCGEDLYVPNEVLA